MFLIKKQNNNCTFYKKINKFIINPSKLQSPYYNKVLLHVKSGIFK